MTSITSDSKTQIPMTNSEVFTELASPIRYAILLELTKNPERQSNIAKSLNISIQESQRQFDRLLEYGLIKKRSDGIYSPTPFCDMILKQVTSLSFSQKYKDYFAIHTTNGIPEKFVVRLGELLSCDLIEGTFRIAEIWEKMCFSTKIGMDVISTGCPAKAIEWDMESAKRGAIVRILNGKNTIMTDSDYQSIQTSEIVQKYMQEQKYQRRMIDTIPIFVVVNENEATVQFEDLHGRIDPNFAFYSKDKKFVDWCHDLFSHWWADSMHFEFSRLSKR